MTSFLKGTFYGSILILFNVNTLYSQVSLSTYEFGINAGTYIYQGDLSPTAYGSFKTPGFVIGLHGSKKITRKLAVRLDASTGTLKGDESKYSNPAWRQERAFKFSTPVVEMNLTTVFYPLGSDRKFSPFIFAGIGYSVFKIKRDYDNFNAEYFSSESLSERLAEDTAHKLPGGVPIIPLGAGIRYRLTEKFSISSEISYKIMSTDYLDGFSRSGNAEKKDHYYKYSVALIYSLRGRSQYDCPVIRP